MTSFHVPTEAEIAEQLAALDGPKVVRLRTKAPPAGTPLDTAAALAVAEMTRKMCLEAAASYVDCLRDAVVRHPENVSPARIAGLLTEIASSIRSLKAVDAPPAGPGSAA